MSTTSTHTVLVIEDDPVIAELLHCFLSTAGYRVLTAGSGTNGLLMARLYRPDAILCDLGLPEMPGNEVLVNLRQTAETREIPFALMTGSLETDSITGADALLTKPFYMNEVVASVGQLITGCAGHAP